MNDMHPDIVLGEPIPEIEPRIDRELMEYMSRANRQWRWFLLLLIVLAVLFGYFHTSRWIVYPVVFGLIILWRYSIRGMRKYWRAKRKSGEVGSGLDWSVPIRVNIEYFLWIASFMIIIFFLFGSGQDGVSGIFQNLGTLLLTFGGVSIYLGRVARQPGQICCKHCEYPLAGLTLPNPCPECGKWVMGESHTTDRPRVRSRWFLWGGLGAGVLGLMVMYASIFRPGFMYGPVPRGVLLKMASTDRGAFDRLMLNPLTPDEEQHLIDAMVANRSAESYNSSFAQGQWISKQILAGRLSEAQLESVFRKTSEIEIDAPSSAKVGTPIELRLNADYVPLPSSGVTPKYYFRGFMIDDDPTPQGGDNSPHYRLYITTDEIDSPRGVPKFIWTPQASGVHTLHARLVLALFPVAPGAGNVQIDWSQPEDSMFGMAPIWSHVVDLEKTIEVIP